ncbi:MAG: hypothetical protein IPL27_01270 [Lewinellaceae bacterium]|nr:hypothetical protein [Lewinellaceae bacterium]
MLACLFAGCQSTPDAATAEKMVREANAQFQQQPYQTMEQNTPADYVLSMVKVFLLQRADASR